MSKISLIASVISEIRGEMSDKEFADALDVFTEGKFHPNFNTIQKWRTGQREPNYDDFRLLLSYGTATGRLSATTLEKMMDYFYLARKLTQEEVPEKIEQTSSIVNIPILGKVPAGYPINVEEYSEGSMQLPKVYLKGDDYFCLTISGDSMKDIDIEDGDLALVHKSDTAEDGQTVVARVNGDVTVKKFYRAADKVILVPANKDFQPIQATDVQIVGIVERVIKNWR